MLVSGVASVIRYRGRRAKAREATTTVPSMLRQQVRGERDLPPGGGQVLDVHKADDDRIRKHKTDIN